MENNSDYQGYVIAKNWSSSEFGKFTRKKSAYYLGEFERAGIDICPGIKCLEIGFGNGSFASWSVSRGAQYFGVEIIDDLLDRAKQGGFEVGSSIDELNIAEESLDLVVAFDILEHLTLDELRLILSKVWNCLKPGGQFFFRVPNGDSPFGRYMQNGDMTHCLSIGSGKIRQLAQLHAFKINFIGDQYCPIFYDKIFKKSPSKTIKTFFKKFKMLLQDVLRRIVGGVIAYLFFPGVNCVCSSMNICACLRK
jgi:2-polyprenyl-3-methyl-5-hydroxy-6-metoxy-1,4-benzoquinol methylase